MEKVMDKHRFVDLVSEPSIPMKRLKFVGQVRWEIVSCFYFHRIYLDPFAKYSIPKKGNILQPKITFTKHSK